MLLTLSGSEKLAFWRRRWRLTKWVLERGKARAWNLKEPGGGREQRAESRERLKWRKRTHTFLGEGSEREGALGIKKGSLSSLGRFRVSCVTNIPLGVWHIVYPLWAVGGLGFWDLEGHFGDFGIWWDWQMLRRFAVGRVWGEDGRWGCSVGDSLEWRCSVPKVSCELLRMPPFVISLPALIFFYVFFLGQLII